MPGATRCLLLASFVIGCVLAGAQQAPPVPTLQAHARAVLVDVVVTDGHGHPVPGLTAADFHVAEDGQPQTIASFEEHHALTAAQMAAGARPPVLPPNTFSNIKPALQADASVVILLDALDTPFPAQSYVRDQTISFLKTMQPGTPVAIFQLDTQIHLLQGFTTDPAVLLAAVQGRDSPKLTAVPQGEQYAIQAIRMDILNAGMQTIGNYLQQFPGRKNLAWFTGRVPRDVYDGGLGSGTLHDAEFFAFDYSKLEDTLTLGRISVYPIDSRGLQTDPAFSAANGGRISTHSTERFVTRQFFEHGDLDDVAQATGGHAFYDTNGIKQALAQIVATGSDFYTLSYAPTNKAWNGDFRTLKLTTDRPGVQLEYRPGYTALREGTKPRAVQRAGATVPPGAVPTGSVPTGSLPPGVVTRTQITHTGQANQFHDAMALGAVDPGTITFEAHVVTSGEVKQLPKGVPVPKDFGLEDKLADKPYRDYRIDFQVDGRQLQLSARPDGTHTGSAEFVALVYTDTGILVGSESSAVNMTLKPETYAQVVSEGIIMTETVHVPAKGQYFLRLGVHDQAAGRAGALQASVSDIKAGTP